MNEYNFEYKRYAEVSQIMIKQEKNRIDQAADTMRSNSLTAVATDKKPFYIKRLCALLASSYLD